ncbi:MAG: hypothetical protein Salg2KO_11570 [Salibacteraceae bacterium]
MRVLLFVFHSLVLMHFGMAQTPPSGEITGHISYMANNAIRPGVNFGLEYGIADKMVLKSKVKRGKGSMNYVKAHQIILGLNTGVVWHPETSTSSISSLTMEYRKTTKRRMQWQLGLGGGYLRSFFPNSYSVNEDGVVSYAPIGSVGYPSVVQFIGYGRYRFDARTLQWWHIRINAHYLLGYNGFLLPYLTSEIRLGLHKKPLSR